VFSSGCKDVACVAEGTLIRTPTGDVPVERLTVGNVVQSWDAASNRLVPAVVIAIRESRRQCLALFTDSGRSLVVTGTHPLYSPESGTFGQASLWREGKRQQVLSYGRVGSAVARVARVEPAGSRPVYDLTISPPHHNFLANGIVVHNKLPPPDDVPPTAVADLSVLYALSNSVRLQWTSPKDEKGDGSTGTVMAYEIRYSTQGITEGTWQDATPVPASPVPREAGTLDGIEIRGLTADTMYYFGIKSVDDWDNWSGLSNIASGRTAAAAPL